jgi:hypothetical protein
MTWGSGGCWTPPGTKPPIDYGNVPSRSRTPPSRETEMKVQPDEPQVPEPTDPTTPDDGEGDSSAAEEPAAG